MIDPLAGTKPTRTPTDRPSDRDSSGESKKRVPFEQKPSRPKTRCRHCQGIHPNCENANGKEAYAKCPVATNKNPTNACRHCGELNHWKMVCYTKPYDKPNE